MLQKFVDNHGQDIEQIRAALNAADDETSERLAHTLKGVAGNIGASSMQKSAEHLETMIRGKAQQDVLDAALVEAAVKLNGLTTQLRAWFVSQAGNASSEKVANCADVIQIATHLRELLADHDAEASQYYATNKMSLLAVLSRESGSLDKAMRTYDYEAALAILKEITTDNE
jgi:two-component system sensor histidine kinase/response regulator